MAITYWIFVDFDGVLRRFPVARWLRIRQGEEPWPGRAGEDIHAVQVMLDVGGRRVERVRGITPYRVPVDLDGFVDREASVRMALERLRLGRFPDIEIPHFELGLDKDLDVELDPIRADPIRRLQLNASHFWALRAAHIADLARALGRNAHEVRAAVHQPELLAEARA